MYPKAAGWILLLLWLFITCCSADLKGSLTLWAEEPSSLHLGTMGYLQTLAMKTEKKGKTIAKRDKNLFPP